MTERDEQEDEQQTLFIIEEAWKKEWRGMPEFSQEDLTAWKSITVHFESVADMAAFSHLIQQPMTPNTRSIWFPEAEIGHMVNKRYADES